MAKLLNEVMECPLCGHSSARDEFTGTDLEHGFPGRFPIVRCLHCGLAYDRLVPAPFDLADAYPQDYSSFATAPQTKYSIFFRLMSFLLYGGKPVYFNIPVLDCPVPGARMLDVGVGSGWEVSLFRERGWNCYGLDLILSALKGASAYGAVPVRGYADCPPFADRVFDLVLANNVVEHVYTPKRALEGYFRILRPGGKLIISLPNFDSWSRRLFNAFWFGSLSLPRHLVHFNKKSLYFGLASAGFTEIQIRSTPLPTVFVGSLLQKLGIDYHRIRRSRLLWSVMVAGVPIDLLSDLFGSGNDLLAVCTKPETVS